MPGTDLHCHLLPGVDDGPASVEESVAYAAQAVRAGTRTIVATPHVELVDVRELPDRVHELRAALHRAGVALEVEVGGELKPASVGALAQDELETVAHGPAGARWVLLEVPFGGVDEALLAAAGELRERGFGLLFAHPERSRGLLSGGLDALEGELRRGRALLEVNVAPLGGREGPERAEAAREVLRRGLAGVVATDAHPPRRPFTLAQGRDAIAAASGQAELGERLTGQVPARLLAEGMPAGANARRAA